MGATSQFVGGLAVLYVLYMVYLIGEMCYPHACSGNNCFHPLLKKEERIDMRLRVGDRETNVWTDVWNTTHVSADEVLDIKVELAVPPEVRRGEQDRLTVEVWLSKHGDHRALARASVNVVKTRAALPAAAFHPVAYRDRELLNRRKIGVSAIAAEGTYGVRLYGAETKRQLLVAGGGGFPRYWSPLGELIRNAGVSPRAAPLPGAPEAERLPARVHVLRRI